MNHAVRWVWEQLTSDSLVVVGVLLVVGFVGWRLIEAVEKRRSSR